MTAYSNSRIWPIATLAFAVIGLASGGLRAQVASGPHASALPATSPTTLPTSNTQPTPIAATPPAAAASGVNAPPRPATVTYAAGLLDVRADNSSLNQILRAIGHLTGMKITGGVMDERVFGNYGPAEPSTILATLLDGTGSNMLLRQSADNSPAELILTPRNGGPTPPNPNAPGFNEGAEDRPGPPGRPQRDQPGQRGFQPRQLIAQPESGPQSIPQPLNDVNGSPSNTSPTAATLPVTDSVPTDSVPTPSTTPSTPGIVDAPNPASTGNTTNTPRTPEQIYQQLQQLQQQRNAGSSSSGSSATPQ
jgi:hypothetical protein